MMLACYGLDERIYLSDRSSPELDIGMFQSYLRRILYPKAVGLIVQTARAFKMAHSRTLNDRICIVPNPIAMRPLAQEEGRRNIILSVGRLISTKNHDRLIRIFASLEENDWELIIVGDDAQKQQNHAELSGIAKQLGVSDRVHLVGPQSNVQQFYDKAKIFAFTSSSEGYPNVVAEALSAGLPVVSYDCVAGPAELITNSENGFLVEVFDDIAFCERLSTLTGDEEKRIQMGANARNSVAHLSPENVALRVLRFMECIEE